MISDTGFFEGNRPAITVGLRGIAAYQLDVWGPGVDLHSGSYGGTVENPIYALATIIAQLKGSDGRVRVPGLLRRRPNALRDRPRGVRGAPDGRGRLPRRDRLAHAPRRARLLDPRAQRRPADARDQRHLGRLPGRRVEDDHPGARPREADLPPRRRPVRRTGRSRRSATTSCSIAPPTVRVELTYFGGGTAVAHADRPSGDAGGGARHRGHVRRGAALHPRGRLDPGRRLLRDRSSGCRSCCSASRRPTTAPIRPTST